MVLESKNKGNVLTLSFNDEKTKNSISANDWIEFRKQVKEFDESDLKYLVLSQSNGNFSSGAQLGENLNALMDDVTDAAQALWDCRKPVISLVDGICAGAGANMILLSDFIIESIDENFGFSRYAERLGQSANSFDQLYSQLKMGMSFIDSITLKVLEFKIKAYKPTLVCFSIPFPGNLFSGLRSDLIRNL